MEKTKRGGKGGKWNGGDEDGGDGQKIADGEEQKWRKLREEEKEENGMEEMKMGGDGQKIADGEETKWSKL